MAILGGAGNPVGGSFTGPAQALEIVGDHAYGYSGSVSTANQNVEVTMIDFTTGNYYTVATWQAFYNEPAAEGDDMLYLLYVGGSLIDGLVHTSAGSGAGIGWNDRKILIPSYTQIQITVQNKTGSDPRSNLVKVIGRIYR